MVFEPGLKRQYMCFDKGFGGLSQPDKEACDEAGT
jgi:hypothetical protein